MSDENDPLIELSKLIEDTLQEFIESPKFKTLQNNLRGINPPVISSSDVPDSIDKLKSRMDKLKKMEQGFESLNKFRRDMNSLRNS